jgi:signal transduction histidine kinase
MRLAVMKMDFGSFKLRRISGQIAIIVVSSLITIHVVLTAAFFIGRSEYPPDRSPEQFVTVVRLVDATSVETRPRLITDANAALPGLDMTLTSSAPVVQQADAQLIGNIRHRLGPGFRVGRIAPTGSVDRLARIAVQLSDGAVVSARIASAPAILSFGGPIFVTLLFIALCVSLLSFWAARALTEPLRSFAKAAESFRPDSELAPLPERGPDEVRAAARALNRMRERVKDLVEGRTRMLAAVSHDLRTPITRLRLRSEFIDDPALRTQTLDELAHMSSMVESVLVYLRGGEPREPATMIDVATSVQTICDQFADMGNDIVYEGPDRLAIEGFPEEIRRAVTNLVDNAVCYGTKVLVQLIADPFTVSIAIQDDGPGILAIDREAMQQPFVRGDAARGMNGRTGFGLGLSIATAAVEIHGGRLELLDRVPSGLIARITLPRWQSRTKTPFAGLDPGKADAA